MAGVRQLRNRLSDVSVSRLLKRISELETYRNRIASYVSSDKALYLAALQHVVGMLILICMGLLLLICEYAFEVGPFSEDTVIVGPRGGLAVLAALTFTIAFFVGISAVKLAQLNTPKTIPKKLNELDSEIAGLKSKLDARRRASP